MVDYTKTYLPYWNSFFQDELSNDPTNETLKKITKTLSDPYEFGIVSIYIHFISLCLNNGAHKGSNGYKDVLLAKN